MKRNGKEGCREKRGMNEYLMVLLALAVEEMK
jgi:hypothetical protein